MKPALGGIAGTIAALAATAAMAGPWVQPKGQGQLIVKYEDMRATQGYDPDGALAALLADRTDRSIGAFFEYGLTDRLTLQVKSDYQNGEDVFVDYEGRGPLEVGVTWQAWRNDRTAVSFYAGYASGGEGRNAGYAAPGVGKDDWEIRASVGRSFDGRAFAWMPDQSFVDVQAARRQRDGLPDETRADFTVGGHFGGHWMVLGQAFGGVTDDGGARWLSVETSVVRNQGPWSFQAGWRRTVAGRETPLSEGPVIAIWRRF